MADGISRRTAMLGSSVVAVAGLAGCGAGDEGPEPGTVLGSVDDIEVGGGKIFADHKVVVTQPEEGEFRGFSAVCTHRGCVVKSVGGGTINCTCHGSKFEIADGSVARGPAEDPLPGQPITVDDPGEAVTA